MQQCLAAARVRIIGQNRRRRRTHRRHIILTDHFEDLPPDAGERAEANPLLKPELGKLLMVFEHFFLAGNQAFSAFAFTQQNFVIDLIPLFVVERPQGMRSRQNHGDFFVVEREFQFGDRCG